MFNNTMIFEGESGGSKPGLRLSDEDRAWLLQKGVTITSIPDQAISKLTSGQILVVAVVAENLEPGLSKFLRLCQKNLGVLPQWQIFIGDNPSIELQQVAMEMAIKTFWPLADVRKMLAPWILEQNRFLTDKSEDADRNLRVAVALAQGKLEVIEKTFESLKQEATFDYRMAYYLGLYLDQVGQTENSLNFINQSLSLNSKFLPAIYAQAQKLLESGKPGDALSQFERLEAINPNNPDRKALMAQAYADSGDWTKAKELRNAAFKIEPDNSYARELNVRIAFEEGDVAGALKFLDECQTSNDYFIRKLNAEAVKLSQNNQAETALSLYNKAWQIAPKAIKFRISYNIAMAYYRQNRFEEASQFCARAESECVDPSFDKIAKLQKALNEKVA